MIVSIDRRNSARGMDLKMSMAGFSVHSSFPKQTRGTASAKPILPGCHEHQSLA
jgi:hypothetical protein